MKLANMKYPIPLSKLSAMDNVIPLMEHNTAVEVPCRYCQLDIEILVGRWPVVVLDESLPLLCENCGQVQQFRLYELYLLTEYLGRYWKVAQLAAVDPANCVPIVSSRGQSKTGREVVEAESV